MRRYARFTCYPSMSCNPILDYRPHEAINPFPRLVAAMFYLDLHVGLLKDRQNTILVLALIKVVTTHLSHHILGKDDAFVPSLSSTTFRF
jgi:hypothetical protein